MQFLPSVRVKCDHCLGNGFKQDILKIKYKSKNIVELLDLSINESFLLIEDALPETKKGILTNIIENGMGYIKLGQKLKTLSSGELQRIKLIKYLNMKKTNAIFLIDEPSFGLHYHDIEQVKHLFDKIVNNNNTIVAVEHNLNLIMHADYIIELGPEGGDRGGYMIFHGNLKDIISVQNSITGRYIKKKL